MTGGLTGSLDAVRAEELAAKLPGDREIATGRRNVVDILAGRSPKIIGWLYLPLSPAQQAAIAAFETRHCRSVIPHLLDALDDIIFDTGRRPEGTNRQPDDTTPPSTQRTA